MKTFPVWWPDAGESADTAAEIQEVSAEDAALYWAKVVDNDSDVGVLAQGDDKPVVYIRDKATTDAKPQRFRVMGEYIPTYYADEEEEPTP